MAREIYFNASSAFDDRGLGEVFAPAAVMQAFLDVERAVALAQAELRMIPAESAAVIAANCDAALLDPVRMQEGHDTTRHPLMPLINELVRLCGETHGGYVHWGITTQNVIQTGLMLLAKRAQHTIDGFVGDILHHLGRHAVTHADTLMAGRTHYRHAVPITFGFKVAVWIEELLDCAERLRTAGDRAFQVMSGGAVGCFSALGPNGPALQARVADILGMDEMAIPSRGIRTRMCDWVNALTLLASVCHKIAEEVYQSGSEEYGELHEGRVAGSIGSSTMPQKINPILGYGIIENSRKLYAQAAMLMGEAHRPFESDGSTNLMFENAIAAVVGMMGQVLARTEGLVGGLVVDAARMRANLDLSQGAIHAEFAMMRLSETEGKHRGHEMVHEVALAAAEGGPSFPDGLAALPGGAELRREIEARMRGEAPNGLCAEFARHFGALALAFDPAAFPPASQRRSLAVVAKDAAAAAPVAGA